MSSKFSNKRFFFLSLILGSLLAIMIINSRTPFFIPEKGGWSVGYGFSKEFPTQIDPSATAIFSEQRLQQESSHSDYLADPFVVKHHDSFYVFFEHKKFDRETSIGLLTSSNGKNFEFKGDVLKEEFHVSYPNVFKYKEDYYMLPRTTSNQLLLYKASNFPFQWTVTDTLINNIDLADPTLYISDSITFLVGRDPNLKLQLYTANDLFSNWKRHERPTVIMGSEARPAGRIIAKEDGAFLLPIQNGRKGFGHSVSLFELRFNSDHTNYSIEKVKAEYLGPQASIPEFSGGMHHVAIQKLADGYFYVYDGSAIKSQNTTFNWIYPLKVTYLDLKNWVYQKLN